MINPTLESTTPLILTPINGGKAGCADCNRLSHYFMLHVFLFFSIFIQQKTIVIYNPRPILREFDQALPQLFCQRR